MFNLTDNASKRFKEFLEQEGVSDSGIRIFLVPGGWRPSLAMDIANAAEDNDIIIDRDGLKVFLAKEANNLFSDATIDFLEEQGFVIKGMPQSSSC